MLLETILLITSIGVRGVQPSFFVLFFFLFCGL